MIQAGQPFPNFSLPNQDNQRLALKDFSGKWLVVFVYPKDDTPGCTLEGKAFSASKPEFEKLGAIAVGLSQDDVRSHKDFCNKFDFTVPLLADTEAHLLKAVGIGQSEYKGTFYWDRTTFLVDPQGMVRKVYEKVRPDGHEKQVLEDIKNFKSL